jgi:hypothetical protein
MKYKDNKIVYLHLKSSFRYAVSKKHIAGESMQRWMYLPRRRLNQKYSSTYHNSLGFLTPKEFADKEEEDFTGKL